MIIGAGPAGLTAAYELSKAGVQSVVVEKDRAVGGLARTVDYKGYLFDIGGHRFYTKVKAVEAMWREVLPAGQFLRRPRLSRIYFDRKFFNYPLRLGNTLKGLGVWNSALIVLSYLHAQLWPAQPEITFEQWVSNRFGRRLYELFFKTYTEKVWGIPCSEIMAEWAAQRIKGLSLLTAVRNALMRGPASGNGAVIKTLIDEFDYPTRGPGMMWEAVADTVQRKGGRLKLGTSVRAIHWEGRRVRAVDVEADGRRGRLVGDHVISSMPIAELIAGLEPAAPPHVQAAARNLHYRDFLTIALVVNKADLFPDNWIYIHEPGVKVGRIQNFKNWSPHMVPHPAKTCLGLEYFCFEGDDLWTMNDESLLGLARHELEVLGLARAEDVEDGAVLRVPKAYPVYDAGYARALATIREFLAGIDNLHLVGRNGMHHYNNQDHSMLTAMLTVRNILGGERFDVWKVNVDPDYLEDGAEVDEVAYLAATQPLVPRTLPRPAESTEVEPRP